MIKDIKWKSIFTFLKGMSCGDFQLKQTHMTNINEVFTLK
jgi:hypothetical protein